jgi:phosphoribosylaminoimidazole carboxylase (NCAIR synthetase)
MASSDSSEEKPVNEKSEEKMVIHMNIAAHQLLSKLLRPKSPEHDWESLAELMGFTYEDILNLRCDQDPVESITRQWERQSDATINKLLSFLSKIERPDVIEDLQQFICMKQFETKKMYEIPMWVKINTKNNLKAVL